MFVENVRLIEKKTLTARLEEKYMKDGTGRRKRKKQSRKVRMNGKMRIRTLGWKVHRYLKIFGTEDQKII